MGPSRLSFHQARKSPRLNPNPIFPQIRESNSTNKFSISLKHRKKKKKTVVMDSTSATEEFKVGSLLSIKTTLGDVFQAQVITFDRHSNFLVLQEGSKTGGKKNIRLLKVNYVKEFTCLGLADDPLDVNNCFIDLNTLQSREESAIRQAEAEAERIGVGVTSEAQTLFDALSKTLPVRWDKNVIVVMNEVRVCSPYLPESVSGGTAAANERVRKVVRHARDKKN